MGMKFRDCEEFTLPLLIPWIPKQTKMKLLVIWKLAKIPGMYPNVCAVLSLSVVYNSLQPHGLQPARLLCPWDSPGKNTGVGCHATQGLNPGHSCLLHWQAGSLPLMAVGKPNLHCAVLSHSVVPNSLRPHGL